mgnify:CR=1
MIYLCHDFVVTTWEGDLAGKPLMSPETGLSLCKRTAGCGCVGIGFWSSEFHCCYLGVSTKFFTLVALHRQLYIGSLILL